VTASPATLVLDKEAVQALADVQHRQHRRAVAFIEVANQRSGGRRQPLAVVVPVAVRVEAGWDRSAPQAAFLNRISRARDVALDSRGANRATQLRHAAGVSVVDATLGHAAEVVAAPVAILTSDLSDMGRVAGLMAADVRVVHL
jgi:hypothetical protein